jgi:hypothetical protein
MIGNYLKNKAVEQNIQINKEKKNLLETGSEYTLMDNMHESS